MQPSSAAPLSHRERRHRRYTLRFPVCVSFPSRGSLHQLEAISENVSIGGLLLKVQDSVPPMTQVSLIMDVKGPYAKRSVHLSAKGTVVRVEELGPGAGFAIAIECQQPITAMKRHLSLAS
jgi:hypothetical protein